MVRSTAAVALCVTAVLAAHEFAYRVAAPSAAERDELLHASGHGWFSLAPVLVALSFGALAATVATTKHPGRVRHALAPLAALAYVAVEFLERLAHGLHDHGHGTGLVHLPTLLVGAAFAAVLAFAGSLLLATATNAVVSVWFRVVRLARPVATVRLAPSSAPVSLTTLHLLDARRGRAPPRLLTTHC